MFEKIKAHILFEKLLGRPDIEKAYAMVKPTDAWYDTITKVHDSLKEIKEQQVFDSFISRKHGEYGSCFG